MELMQDDKTEIQNYLFAEFASMEAKDMFRLAKNILGGNDEGKQELERIVKEIIDQISKDDYEETLPTTMMKVERRDNHYRTRRHRCFRGFKYSPRRISRRNECRLYPR